MSDLLILALGAIAVVGAYLAVVCEVTRDQADDLTKGARVDSRPDETDDQEGER